MPNSNDKLAGGRLLLTLLHLLEDFTGADFVHNRVIFKIKLK